MSCPSVKLYFRSRMYHSKVMERYYITRSVSDGCLHKYKRYIMSPLSAHSKPGAIIFCYNNKRSNNTRLGRLKRSPKFKVCSSYQFLNQLRANKQTNKINHWVLIYKIVVHFGVISDLVTHQIFGDLFSLPKRVLFDRLLL